MQTTVAIYQRRTARGLRWVTLGLGPLSLDRTGRGPERLRQRMATDLRAAIADGPPRTFEALRFHPGTELLRVHLEVTLRGGRKRKLAGRYPLVVEVHPAGGGRRLRLAYHPDRQDEFFAITDDAPLEAQAAAWFRGCWASLDDDALDALQVSGRDSLRVVYFDLEPVSPIDRLDSANDAPERKPADVLSDIGVDLTVRVVEQRVDPGVPRQDLSTQLAIALCAGAPRSTVLVGPPGSGRTTALVQGMRDRLREDGYAAHANLDRVFHFWSISGQRLVAGHGTVGGWEGRCGDLVAQVRGRKIVLVVEDLWSWGRVGQALQSERSLADFFRVLVTTGDVVLVGEATPEQWDRLRDQAPAFAAAFEVVEVPEATLDETRRMLLHAVRRVELERGQLRSFAPGIHARLLSLGDRLLVGRARPGRVVELLDAFAERRGHLGADDLPRLLGAHLGLPPTLLETGRRHVPWEERRHLERRVMGQPDAVEAAVDLVCRVRAGLTDPGRPYAVYLFTGPTGTGKTELARRLAMRLYGHADRLVRFDMSEFNGPDAPARLVGDRLRPEGLLVTRVRAQPFSLLLLDEIEKAHRSVLNLLLQVFDEGRLTDAAGRTADFTHTVVVMTSNLGARHTPPSGFVQDPDAARKDVAKAVRAFFAPELFNRIDRVVPFGPLSTEAAHAIARKELRALLRRRGLADRDVFVRPTDQVLTRVVEQAFDARDGARPLKRYLEREVAGLLAAEIARDPATALRLVTLYVRDDAFQLQVTRLSEAEPHEAPLALDALLSQPVEALREALPAVLAFLDELEGGETLARLSEEMSRHLRAFAAGEVDHADPLHALDEMRAEVAGFRARVEAQLGATVEADTDDVVTDELAEADARGRLFSRVALSGPPRPTRAALLETLSEVHVLRRLLASADDAGNHAVRVSVRSMGSGDLHLVEALTRAYGAAATLTGLHIAFADGQVRAATLTSLKRGSDLPRHVLLDLVGLGVRDRLEGDTGVHVWQTGGRETQVVEVEVGALATDEDPEARLHAAAADERARQAALETGSATVEPTRRPVVRRFRSPRLDADAAPTAVEVEDYGVGHAATVHARTLGEVMARVWMLRASR